MKDLTGIRFGRLLVEAYAGKTSAHRWQCRCDCGTTKIVSACNLGRSTNSCGCLEREARAAGNHTTHGMSARRSPYRAMYFVWNSMVQRCINPKNTRWDDYGGRGIRVCESWRAFRNFAKDMAATYQRGLSLERNDNDGNYEPGNCQWAPRAVQAVNTRRNLVLEHRGERLTSSQWAQRLGIGRSTIESRLKRGWSIEQALATAPIQPSAESLRSANVALKRARSSDAPVNGVLL